MATPTFIEGFECQSLLAHGGSTSGTPTVVAGGPYGSFVLQCAPAGAACWVKTPTTGVFGGTYAVHRFRFRFTSALPAANVSELAVWFTPGSDFALGFVQATGKIELRKRQNAVGTGISSANTITAGQWYRIEVRLYVGATTWTGDWAIDGTAQTQLSWAEGATNAFDSCEFGTSTTDTYSAQYDDSLCSATSTDYPLGNGKVLGYGIGNTSGTHNQTAGDLQTEAAANVTNGDGSGVKLAEDPPDTTTFIQQVVARATTYYEGIYQTSGATAAPTCVQQLVAVKNVSGTQANVEKSQLYDGTAAADAYALTSIGSTSLVYRRKVWTAAPSTGAWTLAKFQAARIRWGFSTDVAPVPAISWSVLEADFTVAAGVLNSQTLAATMTATVTFGTLSKFQRALAVASTLTPVVATQSLLKRALAVASAWTVAAPKLMYRTLPVASTLTPAMPKLLYAKLAVAGSFGVTLGAVATRLFTQALAVASTFTAAMQERATYLRALAVASSHTAAMVKQARKTLSVAMTDTVAMVKLVPRTLAVASTLSVSMRKLLPRSLAVAAAWTVAQANSLVVSRALLATSTLAADLQRVVTYGGGVSQRIHAYLRRVLLHLKQG